MADGVLILKSNWQQGDFVTVETLLAAAIDDDFEYHDLGTSILEVLEHAAVPATESNGVLLKLYENGPCTQCRREVVSKLLASGSVPSWMAEECRFDAMPQIAAQFYTT